MKNKINLTIIDESATKKIVTMSSDLSKLDTFETAKATKNFIQNANTIFEFSLTTAVNDLLAPYNLFANNNDKNNEMVINTLYIRYKKRIKFTDRYKDVNERKLSVEHGKTIIIDKFSVIQCAVEVEIV